MAHSVSEVHQQLDMYKYPMTDDLIYISKLYRTQFQMIIVLLMDAENFTYGITTELVVTNWSISVFARENHMITI